MSDATELYDEINAIGRRINALCQWADTIEQPDDCPDHSGPYVGRISGRCYHPAHGGQEALRTPFAAESGELTYTPTTAGPKAYWLKYRGCPVVYGRAPGFTAPPGPCWYCGEDHHHATPTTQEPQ